LVSILGFCGALRQWGNAGIRGSTEEPADAFSTLAVNDHRADHMDTSANAVRQLLVLDNVVGGSFCERYIAVNGA
jgi:hypothetical protein